MLTKPNIRSWIELRAKVFCANNTGLPSEKQYEIWQEEVKKAMIGLKLALEQIEGQNKAIVRATSKTEKWEAEALIRQAEANRNRYLREAGLL